MPLEDAPGEKLFERAGPTLRLTEMGRTVFGYADEIFLALMQNQENHLAPDTILPFSETIRPLALFSGGDGMIPRQERIGDWRRAETLYQQLKSLRRNPVQWLVAEPGPQAQECRRLTDDLLQIGKKYGVGHDVARTTTLQEFFVGILQAIDNLDPTIPAP